jgi:hypothetical protein
VPEQEILIVKGNFYTIIVKRNNVKQLEMIVVNKISLYLSNDKL